MKVPFEWLKEHVTVRSSAEALAKQLTMAGHEVVDIARVDGEAVLDVEVTPNRADCLSIVGIAREVAAITSQRLKPLAMPRTGGGAAPSTRAARGRSPSREELAIRIEDRQGCLRYIGRLLRDVTIQPSPEWMQRRLIACGARPINTVVDITNYVLFESGQPLHAFDFDRLAHGTILVRRARAKETLTTLDGIARTLEPEMLVIADANHAVAVAGIMGGVGSEVTAATRHVLLEAALFDPIMVRRAARQLGVASESSYRFERGVDPGGLDAASARAAELMTTLAGGRERARVEVGAKPVKRTGIVVESSRVSRWLGMPLSPTSIRTTLATLACRVAASGRGERMHVSAPSFRQDLTHDVDVIEEVARLTGYEKIPSTLPSARLTIPSDGRPSRYERVRALKAVCAGAGLSEVITWSLVSASDLAREGQPRAQAVRLANPLSQDHAYLRPSLLTGLLRAVRQNVTQGRTDLGVFELGAVVRRDSASSSTPEQAHVGIALSGWWLRDWGTARRSDLWMLKGVIQTIVRRFCGLTTHWRAGEVAWAQPGQGAIFALDGRPLGIAGGVCARMREAFDVPQEVWAAELDIEPLLAVERRASAVGAPPSVPPVKRDVSMLLDERIPFASVERTIRAGVGEQASRLELVDVFTGTPVPTGKRSLTFSIEYQDPSRTLTAEEAEAIHQRVVQALVAQHGAILR